jgi:hypothetical protein
MRAITPVIHFWCYTSAHVTLCNRFRPSTCFHAATLHLCFELRLLVITFCCDVTFLRTPKDKTLETNLLKYGRMTIVQLQQHNLTRTGARFVWLWTCASLLVVILYYFSSPLPVHRHCSLAQAEYFNYITMKLFFISNTARKCVSFCIRFYGTAVVLAGTRSWKDSCVLQISLKNTEYSTRTNLH